MKIQKRLKTTLALLMAFALLAVGMPVMSISAEGAVCKIGETAYNSLADAISAAKDGDVINVTANTEFQGTIAKNVTITSQNGSTISNASIVIGVNNQAFEESKEVTFSGNLKLRATGNMFDLKSGTLTFKGNVDVSTTGNYVLDNGNGSNAKIVCNVMENASIKAESPAKDKAVLGIFQNKNGSALNISGGTITQTNAEAFVLKFPDDGDTVVNITGGNLVGAGGVIQYYGSTSKYKGFEINISGGRLIAGGSGAVYGYTNAAFAHINVSGDAYIEAENDTVQLRQYCELNVTGGTIIARESQAIIAQGMDAMVSISGETTVVKASLKAIRVKEDAIVNIFDGLIEVSGNDKTEQYGIWNEAGMLNIEGGTFVLDGNWGSSQMIFHAANSAAITEIIGGLFINKCDTNITVFGAGVTYISGRVLYGDNILEVQASDLFAPKTAKVTYGGETYYSYNRFEGNNEDYSPSMVEGASIRFAEGSNGLRFVATFTKSQFNSIESKGNATFGMIIVPVEYLVALESFSIDALNEKYGENGYLNIVCTDGNGLVKYTDGSAILQAAIVNIKADNYDTEFAAVAYVCIKGKYYYSAFDQSINSATVKDVATAALADTEAAYTDEQKAVLNGYVA